MANLTLSVDDELLKQCRLYAVQHDTSVNAMVREFLESLVDRTQERIRAVEELNRISDEIAREKKLTTDWKWNREEVYEDRFSRWDKK